MNNPCETRKDQQASLPMMDQAEASCPGKIEIPTPEEKKALDALLAIKEKVREKQARLSTLQGTDGGDAQEIAQIEGELSSLKEEWKGWETKRDEARHKRMVLLGHEEPQARGGVE